ncbi:MAG: GNAT family N-acetyltransferase [Candidatus Pacebacteria bacterium]|nr:GNAT family N-acetyltransferase [Candidatus Paceibacterota bacterium]
MNITITTPQPEDALGMITVLYKTWLNTYPNAEHGITPEDVETEYAGYFTEEYIEKYQKRLAQTAEGKMRLVAKIGDNVVGVLSMKESEENCKLSILYVLPEHQGKKIGYKLFTEALSRVNKNKDIILSVAHYNQKAISFYKSLGFVETGKTEEYTLKSGAKITEIEMVLKSSSEK